MAVLDTSWRAPGSGHGKASPSGETVQGKASEGDASTGGVPSYQGETGCFVLAALVLSMTTGRTPRARRTQPRWKGGLHRGGLTFGTGGLYCVSGVGQDAGGQDAHESGRMMSGAPGASS